MKFRGRKKEWYAPYLASQIGMHSTRLRSVIVAAAYIAFFLAFFPLHAAIGNPAALFITAPVLLAAWFFGLRGGLIAGLLTFPVYVLLTGLVSDPDWEKFVYKVGPINSGAEVLVASVIGRLRDLHQKLSNELVQRRASQDQLDKRTRELTATTEGLKNEVAERQLAEEGLRESEERYRLLFGNVADGIAYIALDGTFLAVNGELETMLGWSREELVGQHCAKVATASAAALWEERMLLTLAGENVSSLFETEGVHKDGRTVPLELRTRVIQDAQGNPAGYQAIVRDITERQLAEEGLRQSEARYRLIFDSASDAIITFRLDHTIISMNPEAEAMTGYSEHELVGQRATVYLTPDSARHVEERMRQWMTGGKGPPTIECEGVRKDGVIVPFEGRTVFLRDEEGTPVGYQGIFRDITERKEAEEALQASRQELAVVDKISRILSSTLDLDQVFDQFATEVKKLVTFDRVSIQVVNLDTGSLTVRHISGQIQTSTHAGEVVTLAGSHTERSIAGHSEISADIAVDPRFHTNLELIEAGMRSIIFVPLVSKGRVIGSMALSSRQVNAYGTREQSILERMAGQIAPAVENSILFAATVRLGVAVAAVGEGICIIDLVGGIEFVNPALQELLGYEAADLIGQPVSKLYPGGADNQVLQTIMEALSTGAWSGEVELLCKNGDLVPTLEVATPMRERAGQVVSYVCVNTDLRGRNRTEQERRTLEIKALAQSKLATLGQVATGVAHEINQPLTFINTFIQALQEDLELKDLDPERMKPRLSEALRQVSRIDGIVQHLGAFGRRGDTQMSPVSLEEVVDNTLLLLGGHLVATNVEVERQIDANLSPVMGNANELEEVFINLFQNSTDAFWGDQADAKISVIISNLPDEGALRVQFSDNGVGIAPAHLDRIFEPFFTTKEEGQGTGLGLSIIYGIITDHGGTINCESEYTKGTTITITLPVGEAINAKS